MKRIEYKYQINKNQLFEFKKYLNLINFKKKYKNRIVNSIYYDTNSLKFFRDSEEGLSNRKKIRIRSYNNELNFKYEEKFKINDERYKISKNLNSNILPKDLNDPKYGILFPKLNVSYLREYYQKDHMRITIDSNLIFKNFTSKYFKISHNDIVVEFKTSKIDDITKIDSIIKLPKIRFSKYSKGIYSVFHNTGVDLY